MRILVGALAILAAAFILWGIGSAMRRLIGAPRGRWSVSIGIGLATLVGAGGLLNLAHLAYRPVILVLIAMGIAIGVMEARHA